MHALAAHPIPLGDLTHRQARPDFQHDPISLPGTRADLDMASPGSGKLVSLALQTPGR
jgi:hypothetical protein